MRLPNYDSASIDIAKLSGYVLNANHPEGRHKARVFLSALGLGAANGKWLANAILAAIGNSNAVLQANTEWGAIYRADVEIIRGQRCAKVRTAWLCEPEETRLVTCFVIGKCDENA